VCGYPNGQDDERGVKDCDRNRRQKRSVFCRVSQRTLRRLVNRWASISWCAQELLLLAHFSRYLTRRITAVIRSRAVIGCWFGCYSHRKGRSGCLSFSVQVDPKWTFSTTSQYVCFKKINRETNHFLLALRSSSPHMRTIGAPRYWIGAPSQAIRLDDRHLWTADLSRHLRDLCRTWCRTRSACSLLSNAY